MPCRASRKLHRNNKFSLAATPTPAIFKAEFSWSPPVQTTNAFQEQIQHFQNTDHKLHASSAKVQEQEGQMDCWSTDTYKGSWETPVGLLTIIQNILHVAVTWPSCCCSFISWIISISNIFLIWVISSINLLLLILLTLCIAPWKSLGSVGPTAELLHPWNIPLCSWWQFSGIVIWLQDDWEWMKENRSEEWLAIRRQWTAYFVQSPPIM